MMKSLKTLAAVLAISAVVGLAAGCSTGNSTGAAKSSAASSAAAESTGAIKIGYTPSLCQAPIFVAAEKGYYKDAGINAELIKIDGAHANEAIGSGKIDAMQTLVMKTIHPWQNGLPAKATAGIHSGCVRVVVRGDSDIQTAKDLKGKKIGVAGLADTGTIVTQRALQKNGIGSTPDNMEVEFVVVERNSLPQALESGQIDAFAATDPVGKIAEKQYGFRSVIDTAVSPEFKDEYCCDIVVANAYLDAHPELAKKFTEATMKGAAYVHEHPEEVAKLIADKKYAAGDAADNAQLLSSYNYQPSVKGGYEALKDSAQDLGDLGITKKVDGKAFADQFFYYFKDLADTVTL